MTRSSATSQHSPPRTRADPPTPVRSDPVASPADPADQPRPLLEEATGPLPVPRLLQLSGKCLEKVCQLVHIPSLILSDRSPARPLTSPRDNQLPPRLPLPVKPPQPHPQPARPPQPTANTGKGRVSQSGRDNFSQFCVI